MSMFIAFNIWCACYVLLMALDLKRDLNLTYCYDILEGGD